MDDYGNRSTSSVSSQTITYDAIMVGGSAVHGSSGSLNQNEEEEEEEEDPDWQDNISVEPTVPTNSGSSGSGSGVTGSLGGYDIQSFDHWSADYIDDFSGHSSVQTAMIAQPTFVEIVDSIFTTPDEKITREESVEMLLVLIDNLEFSETDLDNFTDLDPNDPRSIFVNHAAEDDLIDGYPDGQFHGDLPLNRAEALKLIIRFYGLEVEMDLDADNPFKDVNTKEWYAPYVLYAYDKKIVKGYSDFTYKPDQYVSYSEFLKMATIGQALRD